MSHLLHLIILSYVQNEYTENSKFFLEKVTIK